MADTLEVKLGGGELQASRLQEVYALLGGIVSPSEMYKKFLALDQELFTSGGLDSGDENLLLNKIKNILENISPLVLSDEELESRNWCLWLWYHHAAGLAAQKGETENAKAFILKALEYKPKSNHNQITMLLYLLLNGYIDKAKALVRNVDEGERGAASELLQDFQA